MIKGIITLNILSFILCVSQKKNAVQESNMLRKNGKVNWMYDSIRVLMNEL